MILFMHENKMRGMLCECRHQKGEENFEGGDKLQQQLDKEADRQQWAESY